MHLNVLMRIEVELARVTCGGKRARQCTGLGVNCHLQIAEVVTPVYIVVIFQGCRVALRKLEASWVSWLSWLDSMVGRRLTIKRLARPQDNCQFLQAASMLRRQSSATTKDAARELLGSKCYYGIDSSGAARRQIAGECCCSNQDKRHECKRDRVEWTDPKQ